LIDVIENIWWFAARFWELNDIKSMVGTKPPTSYYYQASGY